MTTAEIYKALQYGGAFALPYLITLSHPDYGSLYFVSNNENVEYNGHTYIASGFKYTKPQTIGGVLKSGSLQITTIENAAIDIIDYSDELFTVDVVGVIDEAGDITPLKFYKHQYGTATTDESMNLIIQFTNDDRPQMTFPPYVFDTENNRGNA